jgi:alpha-tubulin suppressor-like RCC1 family protein
MNFKTYFLLIGFLLLAACDSSISTSGSSVGLPVSNDPKITFSGPTYTKVNSCYPLFVSSISGIEKSPVIQSTDLKVNFSSNAANQNLLYKDASCASSVDSTIIGQGGYQSLLYFKAAATDAVVITGSTEYGLIVDPFQFSSFSGANQSAATSVSVYGPSNSFVNECTPFVALLTNSENAFIAPSQNVVVNLSGNDVGYFYSDASCGNLVTTATIVSESTSTSFYFKSGFNKNYILQAQATGLAPALANVNIAGLAAGSGNTNSNTSNTNSATRLLITGASNHSANSCSSFAVILADSTSQPYAAPANVAITLAASNAGTFYSDATCSTSAPITISAGQSSAVFYFNTALSASFILKAQATNYAMAVFPVTFSSTSTNLATALELSGLTTLDSDQCAPFAVSALNNAGIATNTSSLLAVNLSAKNAGLFFSDSTCATSVTSATIASGKSVGYFYYKNNLKTSDLITTDNNALAEATLAIKINAAPVVPAAATPKIIISGVPNIQTRQCSAFSVVSTDSSGNPLNVSANLTVNLSGAGNGTFYQNSNCSTTTTSVQITSGSSLATFYFQTTIAENVSLSTQSSGYLATSFPLQVLAASQQPVALKIVGTMTLNSDVCTPFTINAIDSNGINAVGASNISVTLANIGGSGTFYSDACTTSTSTVTISSGSSYASFYYRNTTAQNSLMTASGTGLGVASLPLVINNSANTITNPTYVPIKWLVSGPTSVLSSSCGGRFTVTSADSSNQAVPVQADELVTLTNGAGNGIFYSDAGCNTVISTATFANGTSQKSFYFKDGQAESVSLQAYSANLIYGSLSVQVMPSGRLNLSMANAGTSIWQNFIYRNRGTLSDRTIVLQNVGLTQANAVTLFTPSISGSFSFRGGTYPGLGGTCVDNSVLLPNQQCTIITRFQPTSVASFADNLKVNYAVGSASLEVNLPLAGVANSNLNPMAVVAGANHTCVTLTDMSTKCFGLNSKGQLGVGNTANYGVASKDIESLSWTPYGHFATQIAAGAEHTCGLMPDGSVICWGDNTYGQLGTGAVVNVGYQPADLAASSYAYVSLGTGKSATKIAAGAYHTCALLQDGTVKCWGENNYGQLGLGDNTNRGSNTSEMGDNLTALDFGVGQVVTDIAAGANHTCVILKGGQLKCWGRNIFGQLGIGSTADMGDNTGEMGIGLSPVSLGSGATVLSVGAGTDHTCAILTIPSQGDPIVKCWGRNDYGQLGIGDALQRGTSPSQMGDALPIVDLGLSGVPKKMALGRVHSCVLLATGSVKCWGSNQYGQTGLSEATTVNRGDGSSEMGNNLPTVTLGASVLASDLSSGSDHICALIDTNKLRCWGKNTSGQLGHDHAGANVASWGHSTSTMASLPDSWVNNYSYYEGIALDSKYTCGVSRSQNEVICWGNNAQSGISYPTQYHDFTSVSGVKQLEAGTGFMCVLANDNKVYCWGDNGWYTNNSGATTTTYAAPNLGAPLMTGISQIAAGEGFLCTLSTTNVIKCFGQNVASTLGTASPAAYITAASAVTMTIPFGTPASIIAGASHACVINDSGNLYCWGANQYGQLGDGTLINRGVPTTITTAASVTKLSLGRHHSCAVLSTGVVQCWGDHQFGQVGIGPGSASYNTAQTVALGGTGTAKDISLGENSSCAVMSDDKLRCWGRNSQGELVVGSTIDKDTPQATFLGQDFRIFMAKAPKRGQHRCAIGWEYSRQVPFQLKCWGDNSVGQLGYNDTTNRGHNGNYLGRAILPVVQNTTAVQTSISSVPLAVRRGYTATVAPLVYATAGASATTVSVATLSALTIYSMDQWRTTGGGGLRVKIWGGGGSAGKGSCGQSGAGYGANGGAGGSVISDVPVEQLNGNLQVWVAGGGFINDGTSSGNSGSGGGSSAIAINGTLVLVAAGGGGGGGCYNGTSGHGGASETNGTANNQSGTYAGLAGTTSGAGGSAGTDWVCGNAGFAFASGGTGASCNSGNAGGVGWSSGGAGYTTRGGGAGGGGYNGGGAGGVWSSQCGSGGGGGSNFIHASFAGFTTKNIGSGRNPGNTGDLDYAGSAGLGGASSDGCSNSTTYNGSSGRVVITPY